MKTTATAVVASILAVSAGSMPLSSHAHGNEHQAAAVFDPVATEFGRYEPGQKVTRTIEVEMSDQMRFTPNAIRVKQGDVIKFVHSNVGQVMHEFVLGTPESLAHHAEMMKKFPGMQHEEPYMAHVAPGTTGVIVWQFSERGEFAFGCLLPGHFDAGMKGTVIVES
jgi:uncharacterized cupredoxin-like copper-binding protein